jgi:hypothetical protein
LLARGHRVAALGDAAVAPKMAPLGIKTTVTASELSLGAMFAAFARGDGHLPPHVQGERLRDRLFVWAERLAPSIEDAIDVQRPDVLIGAVFGSGSISLAAERRVLPWVGVNSTFYIGPDPPRPQELDFGPRTPGFRDFYGLHCLRSSSTSASPDGLASTVLRNRCTSDGRRFV